MASMFDPSGMYGGGVPTAITNALQQQSRRPQIAHNFGLPSGQPPRTGPVNPGGQALPSQANPQAPWAFQGPGMPPGGAVGARPTPPTQGGLGSFANRLEGFDHGKLGNAGHMTPKYQFGRVFSQHDPTKGITQELLDQLNALGIAQVGGKLGGDKLSISGANHPGWEGFAGELDIARDLGRGGWQWSTASKTAGAPRAAGAGASAIAQALGGGNPAYAPGFAGGAPHAASSWLQQLLSSLGVSI